jgi:hypothetical protein
MPSLRETGVQALVKGDYDNRNRHTLVIVQRSGLLVWSVLEISEIILSFERAGTIQVERGICLKMKQAGGSFILFWISW